MLAFILGLIAGAASPTQASVNSKIRENFRSPYITTVVNFIVAGSLTVILILCTERNLHIPLSVIAEQPLWIWLGGACGTIIVLLNIICLPHLGSAANVMLICFGQIMSGLVVDHFGMFYSPQASFGMRRAVGAILVIIGIAMVNGVRRVSRTEGAAGIREDLSASGSGTSAAGKAIYSILAVICGIACTTQVAVNGALKSYAGSGFKATLISMIVGFITSSAVLILIAVIRGREGVYDDGDPSGRTGFRPWMIFGGALAIVIVGGNAVAAPVIGTGICTILNLVGMMAAGLLIDAAGFLGIDRKPVTLPKVAGMIMMIAGAAIISLW